MRKRLFVSLGALSLFLGILVSAPSVAAAPSGTALTINATGTASIPTGLITAAASREGDSEGEGATSFDGLNHFMQRFANNQNQLSIEPPDPALCVGHGFVLESVASAMRVYDTSGHPLTGAVDLNTFYGYPAVVNRATMKFGPVLNDPSCYFDTQTQRWFHVVLTLDRAGTSPLLAGTNHVDIAVSRTSSPLGAWTVYQLPTENDGTNGTPDHGCLARSSATGAPHQCLGDFPRIGADANGFYVTTNEYSFYGPRPFRAAQVYAFSKHALASGASTVNGETFDTRNMVRGNQAGFTVFPATSAGEEESRSRAEYLLSSNGTPEVNPTPQAGSHDLIVWALTNTESLNSSHPDLALQNDVLTVGLYSIPPVSAQPHGSTPLADCIMTTPCSAAVGFPTPRPATEGQAIETGDTRMQQVTFAGGLLFGALDTKLNANGRTEAAIEWFEVRPHVTGEGLHGQVVREGYLDKAGANLTHPALAVNSDGTGAMTFSLVGPDNFPSAAYARFDARRGPGDVHVAAAGAGPVDGITDYPASGSTRMRWGDYSGAVATGSSVWMVSEYIGQTCTLSDYLVSTAASPFGTCGKTRSSTANWDTRITRVSAGD